MLHSSIEQLCIVQSQQSPILRVEAVKSGTAAAERTNGMSIVNDINRGVAAPNNRLAGIFGGVSHRWSQYKTYRKTLDELESLTDRELADLGITRLQLRSIAYKAAYDG